MHVAVDVGTSSTSASVGRAGDDGTTVRSLRLGRTGDTASSAVFVTEDDVLHGDAAERRGIGSPERLVRAVKRRIGDPVPFTIAGRTLPAEDLYARTVVWAVDHAAAEGLTVRDVTVTVPAAWGAHRREAVRAAVERHGITIAAMPTEPEAAAVHYAASHTIPAGAVLAVYDLGAGTFDLAFVRVGEPDEPAVVLHSEGIAELGGADFDDVVVAHVRASADISRGDGADLTLAAVRRECVAAKEALSFDSEALIPLLDGSGGSVRIVRGEFEAMIESDIDRTVTAFDRAREHAGLEVSDIHAIVLSGGSSRIPRVAQLLSEAFDLPLRADADPKSVVSLGAARLGADTARRRRLLALPAPEEPVFAALQVAPRPSRWRAAMTGTAAAAALVGGLAFGGSATALGRPAPLEVSASGSDTPAVGGEPLPFQNLLLPLPVSDLAEGADGAVLEPAPPAVSPPTAETGDATPSRPPLRPGVTPTKPPASPADRLLRPAPPTSGSPQNRPPEARPSADRPPASPPSSTTTPPTTTSPAPSEPSPVVTVPAPEPTADPQPTDPAPDPQPTTDPEPQPEPTTDPEPQPDPTTDPEPQPDPEPTTGPDPSPQPEPEPSPSPELPVPA